MIVQFSQYRINRYRFTINATPDQHVKLSVDLILAHPEVLLSSDAETYVLFTCLELSMNDHDVEMKALARQAQLIIQALELTKSLNRTEALPKTLISKMYEHLLDSYAVRESLSGGANKKKKAAEDDDEEDEKEVKDNVAELAVNFDRAVVDFYVRAKRRATEKRAEIDAERAAAGDSAGGSGTQGASGKDGATKTRSKADEAEEEEDEDIETVEGGPRPKPAENQVGPGGLDPQDVFETLPEVLQEAFLEKDFGALQRAFEQIFAQDGENAKKIMADCVASGLWVTDASSNPDAVDDPRFKNKGEAGQRDSDSD